MCLCRAARRGRGCSVTADTANIHRALAPKLGLIVILGLRRTLLHKTENGGVEMDLRKHVYLKVHTGTDKSANLAQRICESLIADWCAGVYGEKPAYTMHEIFDKLMQFKIGSKRLCKLYRAAGDNVRFYLIFRAMNLNVDSLCENTINHAIDSPEFEGFNFPELLTEVKTWDLTLSKLTLPAAEEVRREKLKVKTAKMVRRSSRTRIIRVAHETNPEVGKFLSILSEEARKIHHHYATACIVTFLSEQLAWTGGQYILDVYSSVCEEDLVKFVALVRTLQYFYGQDDEDDVLKPVDVEMAVSGDIHIDIDQIVIDLKEIDTDRFNSEYVQEDNIFSRLH